ncbi:MAG: hypothetical protein M3Z56_01565 [Bacteroidota bacterium]|nr:hypothetical protein [Bacteroidota bacterium]
MKFNKATIRLLCILQKAVLFLFIQPVFIFSAHAQQTIIQYLSGTDKDHTVLWDFMCTAGRHSNKWLKIPVPSCWEMQGFGTYNYYEDKQNPDEPGFINTILKYHQSIRIKKSLLYLMRR